MSNSLIAWTFSILLGVALFSLFYFRKGGELVSKPARIATLLFISYFFYSLAESILNWFRDDNSRVLEDASVAYARFIGSVVSLVVIILFSKWWFKKFVEPSRELKRSAIILFVLASLSEIARYIITR